MTITPIYAAVMTALYLILSVRVIGRRRQAGISLGDGNDAEMRRRTRAHANFAEYVPLGLILMAMAELGGAPLVLVHLAGVALLLGRVLHAAHLSLWPRRFNLRVAGMLLTFAALGVGAIAGLWPLV